MKPNINVVAIILLCLSFNILTGQTPDSIESKVLGWMKKGDTTIFAVSDEAKNYLDTTQSATKESFAKKYGRWYNFWHTRVDSFGKSDKAWQYMLEYMSSASGTCNDGGNWDLIGPTQLISQNLGIVNSLYVPYANSNTIFAGSNTGGLWRTNNANSTTSPILWECITDKVKIPAMGISSIAVVAVDPNTMYISTGLTTHTFNVYGYGLLKTTNANASASQVSWLSTGLTWELNSWKGIVHRVVTHPITSGFVLAGTDKIHKSTDGGTTFITVLTGPNGSQFHDFEFLPSNPSVIFASTLDKVYYSNDAGENWQDITPSFLNLLLFPLLLDVVNSDPNSVYLHYKSNNGTNAETPLYKTTYNVINGLQPWVLADPNSSNLGTDLDFFKAEFSMSPNANFVYTGALDFKRKDYTIVGGIINNNALHVDIRDLIVFDGGNGNDVLYVGNDGGVSKSVNNGNSWTSLNGNGPQITQFWDMGVTSERKNYIIAGAQDNSQFIYNAGSWSKFATPGGDGFQSLVSWNDPNLVYTSGNGYMALSTDGGTSGTSFSNTSYNINLHSRGGDYVNFVFRQDPNNSNVFYSAKFRVLEKLTSDPTGNLPAPTLNNPQIQVIANLDRCYSNCNPNQTPVYGATNLIPVNPQCTTDLGWSITDIQIAPSNSNIIYMAISWNYYDRDCVRTQKLWKSNNGGLTWSAFGNFWWNITTISVNPENENEIWVGFSGFGNPSNSAVSERVLHCADTRTPSFTDISDGLPMFPIQSLIYQKGGNGTLYCGNDVGVFRYDPTQAKWLCFSSGLPSIIVADLEINYCEKMLYCSAYGRGIWKSPLHEVGAWVVNKNTTINTSTKTHVANDIIVRPPNTLTVKGTLNMSKGRKIIVESGAKLFVDGGKITNLCGDTWLGIEVWGKRFSAQEPIAQGFLEINNGTIEYAKEAVRLWKPGDTNSTGGIVKATNAKFLNNWRSVEFIRYQNATLGAGGVLIRLPNVSSFYKCQFTINDDYRGFTASVPFKGHMSMWDVNGINITGCTFEHKNNNTSLFPRAEDYGYGINTIDASFTLLRDCAGNVYPCSNWAENSFYRLFDGIRISSLVGSLLSPVIEFAHFKDCHFGVFNNEVAFMELVRSSFEIGGFPKRSLSLPNVQEGVVLNQATGFTISENTFSNSTTNPNNAIRLGTRTTNARDNANEIYKNTLSTTFGHLANGVNALNSFPFTGLQYLCNTHSNAISDITAFNGYSSLPSLVIARNQGSLLSPAGNSFNSTQIFNFNNYVSPQQRTISYFFDSTAINQNPVLRRNVIAFRTFNQNACASIFPPIDQSVTELLSSSRVNELISEFNTLSVDAAKQKDSFNLKLDFGNTAQWIYLAQIAGPDTVNANIIGKILVDDISPWVSDTVIRTMFSNTHFSNHRILKTMEANPDVMKDAALMEWVINSGRYNQTQINGLKATLVAYTERTEKEGLIAQYESERAKIVYQLIRNELNNETAIEWPKVEYWLKQIPSPSHDYIRSELYAMLNDWGKSIQIMDSIPMKYKLSNEETLNHADYKTLHQLLQNVQNTNTIANLTTDQKFILEQLAQKSYSRASTQAQSILNFFYDGAYCCPAIFPMEIQARMMQEEPLEIAEKNEVFTTEIKLQPNPSNDLVNAVFSLPEGKNEGIFKVIDITGKVVHSQSVTNKYTGLSFNVGTWSAGIYYVYLEGAGWKSSPVALSVQK